MYKNFRILSFGERFKDFKGFKNPLQIFCYCRSVDRGQDRKIPPAPGTNQIAGFGSSCPLTR